MKPILSCLLFGIAVQALAQTPLSINISTNAALTSSSTYAMTGTGTITGLGTAALAGAGTFDPALLSGASGVVPGSFSLIFADGAVLFGTYAIPTGIVIPQSAGGATSGGSINITGGTGRFEGARGVFAPLTGSGTATGLTSGTAVINGTGSISARQYVLPQFVTGGGWYTALYFSNSETTPETVRVDFVADNGTPLNVPALSGTSTIVTIPAEGSVRIEAPNSGDLVQGYASVTLPVGVTGYGVFRQSVANTPDQEAVVPLANAASTSASFAFDDTNFTTAAGIVNPSSVATTITVTAKSSNGGSLGSATISLAAKSKTAVALRNVPGLSAIANSRGTVTFTVTTGSVAVLGLRFYGSAFTSIPATDR